MVPSILALNHQSRAIPTIATIRGSRFAGDAPSANHCGRNSPSPAHTPRDENTRFVAIQVPSRITRCYCVFQSHNQYNRPDLPLARLERDRMPFEGDIGEMGHSQSTPQQVLIYTAETCIPYIAILDLSLEHPRLSFRVLPDPFFRNRTGGGALSLPAEPVEMDIITSIR